MILFLGTRPGQTKIKQLTNTPCPFCEQTGTLTISKTSNWFHIFWIRLFRISKNVIAECSHCKRVYYKQEFNDAMLRAAEED